MSNLNEQQFAKYSGIREEKPLHPGDDNYEDHPLPASMERHAPGEYQPTLPGMEKMLKGELTHTSVFFKHKNVWDEDLGDVRRSTAYDQQQAGVKPARVDVQVAHLRPIQDWVADNYLHEQHTLRPRSMRWGPPPPSEASPVVEKVPGTGNVLHDGHHRVAREILAGKKSVRSRRWEA